MGEEEEPPQEEEEEKDSEEEEEEEELFDDGEVTARSGTPESTRSRYSSGGAPSLDAWAQLARDLLALKGTELGFVMSILERECPSCLETDEQIPRHLVANGATHSFVTTSRAVQCGVSATNTSHQVDVREY